MTRLRARLEVYRRPDGWWDWRLRAGNGQIVATSGGQGYESRGRAAEMAERVVYGDYATPAEILHL